MLLYTENCIGTFSAKCDSPILNCTFTSRKNYILHYEKDHMRHLALSLSIEWGSWM